MREIDYTQFIHICSIYFDKIYIKDTIMKLILKIYNVPTNQHHKKIIPILLVSVAPAWEYTQE